MRTSPLFETPITFLKVTLCDTKDVMTAVRRRPSRTIDVALRGLLNNVTDNKFMLPIAYDYLVINMNTILKIPTRCKLPHSQCFGSPGN